MSTFAVFGMTEAHAKQMAQRLKPKYLPKQQCWETQSEYEARTAEVAEKYLDSERAVQVSPLFDAPPVLRSVHGPGAPRRPQPVAHDSPSRDARHQ